MENQRGKVGDLTRLVDLLEIRTKTTCLENVKSRRHVRFPELRGRLQKSFLIIEVAGRNQLVILCLCMMKAFGSTHCIKETSEVVM